MKAHLGIDVGSISTKAVVLDLDNTIHARSYIWTEGDPIRAVRTCLEEVKSQLPSDLEVVGVGTTGSARRLTGVITDAAVVKNEITAHAVGALSFYPEARTIFEIGGQDSKIIVLRSGLVVDYAMNTLCAAGTGAFLSSQARRLNVPIEEFGGYFLRSKHPTKIAGRCTVFAESDLVHKAQIGHSKEDIIAGLCYSITRNYLNNVGKGKDIQPPIVFQGGVSKNIGVVRAFEELTGHEVTVDDNGHLMGAIGVAIIARGERESFYDFDIIETEYTTRGIECEKCPNNCEIVSVYNNDEFLDAWGNRCPKGLASGDEDASPADSEMPLKIPISPSI